MLDKQIQATFFYLFILFLFTTCNFYTKKGTLMVEQEEILPPLDSGVIYCQGFDTLIYLRGEKALDDSLLKDIENIFLIDTLLVLNGRDWGESSPPLQKFRHYSLPNMQLLKSVEEQFSFFNIIPTVDSTFLYYFLGYEAKYERQSRSWEQHLRKYDLSGKVTLVDSIILPFEVGDVINDKVSSITHAGNADFIYRKDSLIVCASITEDTVLVENRYSLPMNPNLGQLIINPAKNRMVFAYEYYHLFHIMDLEAKTVKTVDFKNGNHQYQIEKSCMDCLSPNTIYYCTAFAGQDYFYLLYWGYPIQALFDHANKSWKWSQKERKYVKTDEYQQNIPNIVEQYDWKGNPIARYLLEGNPSLSRDHFVVDEKKQQFYLLSADCYATFMATLASYESLRVYSFSKK